MASLFRVPTVDVYKVWDSIKPYIEDAAARSGGKYSAMDIMMLAAGGHLTLWLIQHDSELVGVVGTEFASFPQCKAIRFIMMVGKNKKEWLHLKEEIEAFGRQNGATRSIMVCRPGWARELEDYRKTHVILEKPLC